MLRSFMGMLAPVAAALAASIMAVPANATETSFATFTGLGTSFVAMNQGTSAGSLTLSDNSTVTFGFLASTLTSYISGISANMVFTATSLNANYSTLNAQHGIADEALFSGSLSITSTQAVTVGGTNYAAGSNLLTANFNNATLLGVLGSQDAGLTADSSNGTLIYTSDFLSFANTTSRDYSIALSAILPVLSSGSDGGDPEWLEGFTSTPTGSFATDPQSMGTGDVPEPVSWAMMLVGLGAIGVSLRTNARRKLRAASSVSMTNGAALSVESGQAYRAG